MLFSAQLAILRRGSCLEWKAPDLRRSVSLEACCLAMRSRIQAPTSVVIMEKHRGDRSIPLPADVVRDDPDFAVVGCVVAGEEAAITGAGCFVVGGFVVCVQIAPIALGMAIEEGGDLVVGNGGGKGSGGDDAAKVVEYGGKSCRVGRKSRGPA
jgi:hypothetical protein